MLISSLADLTLREWKANLIEQYSGNNNIIALTASARNSLVTKYKHKAHDLEISLALQVPKLLELKDTCKTNAERLDGASNLKTKLARAKAELETLQNI